ncbi:helix-turn-helix domain-containing protein [Bradyrhizobium sp. Pha-3]|uniref:AraC family transcriptional regulator n=1 Tax=Bradyrhizobium sp. Pha-3 TaxID=208375 RepID=UPI0035D44547
MPFTNSFVFSDPLPYQAALRIFDLEVIPTCTGKFRAELTQIDLEKLRMERGHENLPHVVAGSAKPGRKTITFLTGEQVMVYCGHEVLLGDIIILRAGSQHQRNRANHHWGSMSLTHDDFAAAYAAITGRENSESTLKLVVRPNSDLMSRLLMAHEMVGQMAEMTPDVLAIPEVSRALEQQLIQLMMRCLDESESSEVTTGSHRHDLIVARLEDFLQENPKRPLYLMEICAAIGVAERTLRAACQEHLGMGPIRYLYLRRMHLVRRALLGADPSTVSVTRIATDHGFWELGRFSVSYRNVFGECPSETLRRGAKDRPGVLKRRSQLDARQLPLGPSRAALSAPSRDFRTIEIARPSSTHAQTNHKESA